MPRQESQIRQMKPYMAIAGLLLLLLIIIFLWPSSEQASQQTRPVPVLNDERTAEQERALVFNGENNTLPDTQPVLEPGVRPGLEPQVGTAQRPGVDSPAVPTQEEPALEPTEDGYTPLPQLQEVVIGDGEASAEVEDATPLTVVENEVPEPLDVSDSAIKTSLWSVFSSPALTRLLVSDGLLEKFVINVNDLSNGDSSPRNELVNPPEKTLNVYRQARSVYVDPTSFKRYTPYVEALESADVSALVALYEDYREEIELRFEEISRPGESFDDALIEAIDVLLETPTVSLPYEVYSESVMYKFKDPSIENLPAPQKQLLRTGPDNVKRIKAILRKVRNELNS